MGKQQKHTSRTAPFLLKAAAATAAIFYLLAGQGAAHAQETAATATTTVTSPAKASVSSTTNTNDTAVAPKDEAPKFDKDGFPYYETVRSVSPISKVLAIDLIAAGEIKSAFLDDARSTAALITDAGVLLAVVYDSDPVLLQAFFDAGVVPAFVDFKAAPITEIQRIEEKKAKDDFNPLLAFLPILIMISGTIIIFEIRNHKNRKPEASPDETAYQTREGPAGTIPTVTFADVAGCEEAIEDLSEVVDFLKNPERFEKLGAKIPRGALLVGPPGTGKTLLARAVAGEAKVAFFSASGSDFVEMYVGVGPARIRELFTKARAAEKAIIFIDEIDAVARSRATSTKQNANDERENTLNALLHELDGFSRSNVILLAATNRMDVLDPAVIRPGRLDRKIQVPNPDRRGREKILAVHVADKPLAKNVDLGAIARRTPGMSGADLAQIANEAAIEAVRRKRKTIDADCFSAAVALVAMGRARKSALVTDRDRLITAYHEAGHAVCALINPIAADPAGVSITPRGHAGGITWMNGTDDQYLSRPQAAAQLVVALGGRAGEELLLDGEFTQGPSSDLERATQLATVMVTRYGMTRRGLAVRTGEPDSISHDVIEELLTIALDDARELLRDNHQLFMAVVNQLLEQDTLEASDIADIVDALNPERQVVSSTRIDSGTKEAAKEEETNLIVSAGHAAIEAVHVLGNVATKVVRTARRATPKRTKGDDPATTTELDAGGSESSTEPATGTTEPKPKPKAKSETPKRTVRKVPTPKVKKTENVKSLDT